MSKKWKQSTDVKTISEATRHRTTGKTTGAPQQRQMEQQNNGKVYFAKANQNLLKSNNQDQWKIGQKESWGTKSIIWTLKSWTCGRKFKRQKRGRTELRSNTGNWCSILRRWMSKFPTSKQWALERQKPTHQCRRPSDSSGLTLRASRTLNTSGSSNCTSTLKKDHGLNRVSDDRFLNRYIVGERDRDNYWGSELV